jgi:lipopolysaccharide export LptBFGC system permease protein LptF
LGLLTRYLLARCAGPLLVALALFCGLIWLLQALRLGHHLLGAGLGAGVAGQALLYSLPTLVVFALPLALAAAILYASGHLAETGELRTLRARGASPLQLGVPGLLLTGACIVVVASLALFVEAPALGQLRRTLLESAARTLVLGSRPRCFHRLFDETVLYVDRRLGAADARSARFGGLLLASGPRVLLAREADVSLERQGEVALLRLRDGEVQLLTRAGRLRRVRFGTLEQRLDLRRATRAHFGFLAELSGASACTRALNAAAACLALGLLATVLGPVRGGSRLRMALLGLAGVGLYQLGVWSGAALLPERGDLWPPALALAAAAGSLAWISRRCRRR